MPKAGAKIRSGPPPDPNSGKSERYGRKFRELDASMRRGKSAPKFPLPEVSALDIKMDLDFLDSEDLKDTEGLRELKEKLQTEEVDRWNQREKELWRWAWRLPQAVAWAESAYLTFWVAHWVRLSVLCESPKARAADRAAHLRIGDQIGMTPAGMAYNGWTVSEPQPAMPPAAVPGRSRPSARERMGLKVVNGGQR